MKWLFRFNVAGEKKNRNNDHGMGHATRCLTLAKLFKQKYAGKPFLMIEGDKETEKFFAKYDVDFSINHNEEDVFAFFKPDAIITDINYLDYSKIKWYKTWGPVINLAPRGFSKYYADMTINDTNVLDVLPPENSENYKWYRGPEFSIINKRFVNIKNNILDWKKKRELKHIIISMGGVDQFNLTKTILLALMDCVENYTKITVVAGPFNPHISILKKICKQLEKNVNLLVDPPNFAELIGNAYLGIFANGITTYEAIYLGVPSINIALTDFHDLRGKELQNKGLIKYIGKYDKILDKDLCQEINHLMSNYELLEKMHNECSKTIPANSSLNVLEIISNFLSNYCLSG